MSDTLEFYCWILGDDPHGVFSVKVASSGTVEHLRKAIKNENGGLDTGFIDLWKVDINLVTESDFFKTIKVKSAIPGYPLLPRTSLSEVFLDRVEDNHLYIIVHSSKLEQPLAGPSRVRDLDLGPDADFLALHKTFWRRSEHLLGKQSVHIPDPLSLEVEDGSQPLNLIVIENPEGKFRFGLSKLLVVEIFETFWELLQHEDEQWQELVKLSNLDRFSSLHHATIVTGQPGIGQKTVFLIYVLLRRLMLGKTTIYCDTKEKAHVFDVNGIRKMDLSREYRFPELDADSQCHALVNLSDELESVPNTFYPKFRMGRVVVATSPDKRHWSNFARKHRARICCMPTWPWGPVYFGSLLFANKPYELALDNDHCTRLRKAYALFAGIPRFCYRALTEDGLQDQLALVDEALRNIESLDSFIFDTRGQLPFDPTASHTLVRAEPADPTWRVMRTELLSQHIAELVLKRICLVTTVRLSQTLMKHLADPDAHSKAGIIFEHAAHFAIRKAITLNMICLSASTRSRFNKKKKVDVTIPAVRNNEKSHYYSLDIQESPGSQNVHPDFLNLYMTPVIKTEPSINGLFISSGYTTYLFQMTVSDHHSIKFRALDAIVSKLPAKAGKNIHIVFVTPARDAFGGAFQGIRSIQPIDSPQDADSAKVKRFKDFSQFVCQLDLDLALFHPR